MRKPKPRDRSFQPSGAGKGCADRTTDDAAYRKNFDDIDWGRGEDNEMLESARGYLSEPCRDFLHSITG